MNDVYNLQDSLYGYWSYVVNSPVEWKTEYGNQVSQLNFENSEVNLNIMWTVLLDF